MQRLACGLGLYRMLRKRHVHLVIHMIQVQIGSDGGVGEGDDGGMERERGCSESSGDVRRRTGSLTTTPEKCPAVDLGTH